MTDTKILSVNIFQSYTDFRFKTSHSHLSRKKSVCLFLNITTHCVSLCFFPPTPLAMPVSFVLLGRAPVACRQSVFMWYRKLPDSKLALPCHFDPFLKYVVLARVKATCGEEERRHWVRAIRCTGDWLIQPLFLSNRFPISTWDTNSTLWLDPLVLHRGRQRS